MKKLGNSLILISPLRTYNLKRSSSKQIQDLALHEKAKVGILRCRKVWVKEDYVMMPIEGESRSPRN